MTRSFTATLIAVAFAGGLSAQTPYPQTEKQKPDKKATSDTRGGRTVSLTGCLREGDEPNTFVLANVDSSALMPRRGATSSPSETAGTAGAGAATATVKLIGSSGIDLKAHVGHKVEVTGMLVPQGQGSAKGPKGTAGTTPTETTSDTTSRERGAQKGASAEHRLNVRSIKHVSETCTM